MVKKAVGYKVDEKVLEEFNKLAIDTALNKSQWLENKMKELLKERKIVHFISEEVGEVYSYKEVKNESTFRDK